MVDRDAAAQSMPESGLPRWWWPLSAAYFGYLAWLAAGTRVFLDQVWVTEYGRRLLGPWASQSMYMLPDGSSALPASFLGPIIAELSFRLSGGLVGFRLVNALALLVIGLATMFLVRGLGASRRMSALLGCAVLFDATLVQSVVLGRPDALAISFAVGGMALASTAGSSLLRTGQGWRRLATGYALCALAPCIWASAVLLGPLLALHWLALLSQLRRSPGLPVKSIVVAAGLVPGVIFLIFVVLPYLAAMLRDFSAFDRYFIAAVSQIPFTSYLFQVTSPSVVLVLAGAFGVLGCRSLPVAVMLVVGMAVILFSGFYPFRVPYLVVYLAAATAFSAVANVSVVANRAWERLVGLAVLTAVLLLLVRGMLHMGNERVPMAADSFLVDLPKDQVVADFSWDLYVPARLLGVPIIRSFPGMESTGVSDWLRLAVPDLVVRPAIPAQSWIMVEDDLDSLLEAGGYCQSTTVDWSGNEAAAGWVATPIPSPMLWRLGMYRSHGPYNLWVRCR